MKLGQTLDQMFSKYKIESMGVDGRFEVESGTDVFVGRGLIASEAKEKGIPEGVKIIGIDGCDSAISRAALRMSVVGHNRILLENIGQDDVYVVLTSQELVAVRRSQELDFGSIKTIWVGSPEDQSCFMLDLAGQTGGEIFKFRVLGLKAHGAPIRGAALEHEQRTKGHDEMDFAEELIRKARN